MEEERTGEGPHSVGAAEGPAHSDSDDEAGSDTGQAEETQLPKLAAVPLLPPTQLSRWVPRHNISLSRAGYGVVKRVAKRLGWKPAKLAKCSFAWMDRWGPADVQRVVDYRRNHFPGKPVRASDNLPRAC